MSPPARGPGSQTSVTAVMLTRDRVEFVRRALRSLEGEGIDAWIVVDNASTDGTAEFLAGWHRRDPGRRTVLFNLEDPGPATARNQAARHASSEHLLFLDNDVEGVEPGWVEKLVVAAASHAVAAPTLVFPGSGGIVQAAGGGVTDKGMIGLLHRGLPVATVPEGTREIAWAPAAALLVKSAAFHRVGGFDEAFDPVALLEDVDLCLRLRSTGESVVGVGDVRLVHFEGTTFQSLGEDLKGPWHKHLGVIRRRWAATIEAGPRVPDADVAWRPVWKSYEDLDRAEVRAASVEEAGLEDLSFFRSKKVIPATPPAVRVGIVGCGAIARMGIAPGFSRPGSEQARNAAWFLDFDGSDGARVVGCADTDPRRANEFAELSEVRHSYGTVDELLSFVPLDALAVGTATPALCMVAKKGLERGLHVLVEKPLATSLSALEEFIALRQRFPRQRCAVDMPWSYHPGCLHAAALLAKGALGAIDHASVVFEHSGPDKWSPDAAWYFEPTAGGAIADLGPHAIGMLAQLCRIAPEPLVPVETTPLRASASVALAEGAEADISVGWDAAAPRFELQLTGSEGRLVVELMSGKFALETAAGRTESTMGGKGATPHPFAGGPYRAFIESIQRGRPSEVELSAVAPVLRLSVGWAEGAARTGAPCD